ncbi:MAG: DUF423 domain-containing protein [Ferruginibacter sp.]
MHKGFLKTAAVLAALSVLLGAFAAHGLKGKISDQAILIFETAVRYQFYHVFALFITAILYKDFHFNTTFIAGVCFIAGIILFCGSLYILAGLQAAVQPGYRWVGAITPLGGLAFIVGWLLLLLSFFKKNYERKKKN